MNFWKLLRGDFAGARVSPPADAGAHSLIAAPPELSEIALAAEPHIQHVLPLRWSLSYALTDKQWQEVRTWFKAYYPDWERCKKCPKGCIAKQLDEQWKYDYATCTKIFLDAAFICGGCHWLKTPPFRIKTWLDQQRGLIRPKSKPDHIVDCLGWTEERIDELRRNDLEKHQRQQAARLQLLTQWKEGRATIAHAPVENMPAKERDARLVSGQTVVVPWRVDLSALAEYGYTPEHIAIFETRMYHVAAKRMASARLSDVTTGVN